MQKYKIAIIGDCDTSIPPLKSGGYEKCLFILAKFLSQYHIVHVYSMSNFKQFQTKIIGKAYFHYYFFKSKFLRYIRFYNKIIKDIKVKNFDIIHCQRGIAGVFLKIYRVKGKKIRHFHNGLMCYMVKNLFTYKVLKYNAFVFLNRLGNRYFDVFICNSKYIFSCIKKRYYDKKIFLLHYGLPPSKYSPNELERVLGRKYLNINKNEIVILFAGRLSPDKGLDLLLDAFSQIKDENIKLIIAGIPDKFTLQFNKVYADKMLKRLKNQNRIIYLGELNEEDLIKIYNISDIVCIPSRWQEPFGLVALEGIMMGKPLIARKVGGLPELVINKKIGILYNDLSFLKLKDCIQVVINSITKYNPKEIRSYGIKNFSDKVMCKRYMKILHKIINNYLN